MRKHIDKNEIPPLKVSKQQLPKIEQKVKPKQVEFKNAQTTQILPEEKQQQLGIIATRKAVIKSLSESLNSEKSNQTSQNLLSMQESRLIDYANTQIKNCLTRAAP